jgi:hypothetical protein
MTLLGFLYLWAAVLLACLPFAAIITFKAIDHLYKKEMAALNRRFRK